MGTDDYSNLVGDTMSDLIPSATKNMYEAQALVVSDTKARQLAADLWDAIRAFRKQATTKKEEQCKPLKAAWDQAKKPWDTFIKECEHYEGVLEEKMGEWDREQDRLAMVEQKKLADKIAKQNAKKVEKAEAKGVVPVLKDTPVIQAPEKVIQTQAGTTQTRQTKKVYSVIEGNKAKFHLFTEYPHLYVIDKVAFNKLAATGALDNHGSIQITEEYVYVQRQRSSGQECDTL